MIKEKPPAKIKLSLIPDWRTAWQKASMVISGLVVALASAESQIPAIKENLPPNWVPYAVTLIMICRVVRFLEPKE